MKQGIDEGAHVSAPLERDYKGDTLPLIQAAADGDVELARLLLDAAHRLTSVFQQVSSMDLSGRKRTNRLGIVIAESSLTRLDNLAFQCDNPESNALLRVYSTSSGKKDTPRY